MKKYQKPEMEYCEINTQVVICFSNEAPGSKPEESPELAPRHGL